MTQRLADLIRRLEAAETLCRKGSELHLQITSVTTQARACLDEATRAERPAYHLGDISGPDHDPQALSPREQEVLELIADGLPNREIAACLFIGKDTVKAHIKHLFRKLGVESRTQAVSEAFKRSIILPSTTRHLDSVVSSPTNNHPLG